MTKISQVTTNTTSTPTSTTKHKNSYRGTIASAATGALISGSFLTYTCYDVISNKKSNNTKAIMAMVGMAAAITLACTAVTSLVGLAVDVIANKRAKKQALVTKNENKQVIDKKA